jgi:hypothetical protein
VRSSKRPPFPPSTRLTTPAAPKSRGGILSYTPARTNTPSSWRTVPLPVRDSIRPSCGTVVRRNLGRVTALARDGTPSQCRTASHSRLECVRTLI